MRCLPRPSLRAVFTGDVVAFNSPLAGPGAEHLMVRRVAAVEGEELITDDPVDGSYTIPEGEACALLSHASNLCGARPSFGLMLCHAHAQLQEGYASQGLQVYLLA